MGGRPGGLPPRRAHNVKRRDARVGKTYTSRSARHRRLPGARNTRAVRFTPRRPCPAATGTVGTESAWWRLNALLQPRRGARPCVSPNRRSETPPRAPPPFPWARVPGKWTWPPRAWTHGYPASRIPCRGSRQPTPEPSSWRSPSHRRLLQATRFPLLATGRRTLTETQ